MATYDVTSETTTKDFSSILKDGDIINNGYSGYARSIILPPGIYRFECWGAQGGNATYSSAKGTGGKGCHVSGEITLEDAILYLYTGGKGNNGTGSTRAGDGGWNGGGSCGTNYMGGSGGGATDIRTGGTSLTNRVIIAGGGGGGACFYNSTVGALSADGGGGGQNGENGEIDYAGSMSGFTSARGGTQSAGGDGAYYAGVSAPSGSLGNGGNCSEGGGAGGGGYYGGGGGAYYNVASARKGVAAGAGGSSYANNSFANVVYNSGTRSGDGYITITAIKILKGFAAYYKTSNSWKQITDAFVKVGGSWKNISKMYCKVNGSWRLIGGGSPGPVIKPLNEYTWNEISTIAASGKAQEYFSVGDRKAITLNGAIGSGLTLTNHTTYVYILGFNHNGATNTIDFGTFKTALTGGTDVCLVDSKYDSSVSSGTYFSMNNSATNTNGWKGCRMRYYLLGSTNSNGGNAGTTTATNPVANTLMAALPSDLRQVMKPMTIYTDNVGGGTNTASNVTSSVDYLPLLAEFEIFGRRSSSNSAEQNYQKQYQYYANGNSMVKYQHSSTGSTGYWWERSPGYTGSDRFCIVGTSGVAGNGSAYYSIGVAPAFRV